MRKREKNWNFLFPIENENNINDLDIEEDDKKFRISFGDFLVKKEFIKYLFRKQKYEKCYDYIQVYILLFFIINF